MSEGFKEQRRSKVARATRKQNAPKPSTKVREQRGDNDRSEPKK